MIQRFRGHSPIIHPAARLAANATLVGCVTEEAAELLQSAKTYRTLSAELLPTAEASETGGSV